MHAQDMSSLGRTTPPAATGRFPPLREAETHRPAPSPSRAVFEAAETHLPYLARGTVAVACSEALGWRPAHAGIVMEAAGRATMPAQPHACIAFCIRGGGPVRLDFGGQIMRGDRRRGHLVVTPPGTPVASSAEMGAEMLRLSIRPEILHAAAERLRTTAGASRPALVPTAFLADDRLAQMFQSLRAALHSGLRDDLCVAEFATELVAWLLRLQHGSGGGQPLPPVNRVPRGALAPWRVRKVIAYLQERIMAPVTLAELAGVAGLSESHLSHGFKASTGEPPLRFHLGLRIARALDLLANSELTLQEVALACGFPSQRHLTEAFRRRTGSRPGEWRRNHRS